MPEFAWRYLPTGISQGWKYQPTLITDVIMYSDTNQIPGSIILLDVEKTFDSVDHD